MINTAGLILISIGLFFDFIGSLSFIKSGDIYIRLQIAGKSVMFGTCLIMFGAFLMLGFTAPGIRAILCMLFLIITIPTMIHAIAKAIRESKET